MLDFLRRGVKSWVAKILLALLILSFAVWGIGDIFLGRGADSVAAVGETEVASDRFYREMQRQQSRLSQARRELVTFSQIRAEGIDRQILAGMLRDATFTEELRGFEIAVPLDAVRTEISSDERFQTGDGTFNPVNYEALLSQNGMSPREYEALTRTRIGQRIMVDAIAFGARATPGTARQIAAYQGETRAVATIRLAADDAPDPGLPDDTVLADYFDANSERFIEPERRTGTFLHIDVIALANELAPTEDEVRAEYDANPETYTAEATRTVEQIGFEDAGAAAAAAERLRSGAATWEEIATEQNVPLEDLPLGVVRQGELSEAADEAIFALDAPGIAGPVDGLFGALLLNVTAVEAGGLSPFELVRAGILEGMARVRAQERALELANKIDDVRAGGADMGQLAMEAGRELQTFTGMGPSGLTNGGDQPLLAADPTFVAEVFEADIEEERDILELQNGSFALVMVNEIAASHLPDLATIRERVIAAWQHEQRLVAQESRATDLISTGAANFEEVSAQVLSGIVEHAPFTRDTAPGQLSDTLVETVFEAKEGDVVIGRDRAGDAVLLTLVRSVSPLADTDLETQSTAIADVLRDSIERDQLEYFARAIEDRHRQTIDQASVDYIFEQLGQARGGQTQGGM